MAKSCKPRGTNGLSMSSGITLLVVISSMSLQCIILFCFLIRTCATSSKDLYTLSRKFSDVFPGDIFCCASHFSFCQPWSIVSRFPFGPLPWDEWSRHLGSCCEILTKWALNLVMKAISAQIWDHLCGSHGSCSHFCRDLLGRDQFWTFKYFRAWQIALLLCLIYWRIYALASSKFLLALLVNSRPPVLLVPFFEIVGLPISA